MLWFDAEKSNESQWEREEGNEGYKKKTNTHRVYGGGGGGNDGNWRFIIQFLLGAWFEIRSSIASLMRSARAYYFYVLPRYFIIEIVA